MVEAVFTRGRIDVDRVVEDIIKETSQRGAGALVVFIGFVKGAAEGRRVRELEYTTYEPYASRRLKTIVEEEASEEGVYDIRVYHRYGRLEPGEPTVYIFVAASSRGKAFEKARRVLERVKHEALIFKLERREDGEYWVLGDGRRVRRPVRGSAREAGRGGGED